MDILKTLKQIKELQGVPDDQLQWLIAESSCLTVPKGEYLFKPGQDVDRLLIVLEGKFLLKISQNNQFRITNVLDKHSITGLLPYSRAKKAIGYAEASEESHVVVLMKEKFVEMIRSCYDLTAALVHIMSSRIRQFTKQEQQNDKMMALGKLSAGLAHELNNPSAAVIRSAQELSRKIKTIPEKFKDLVQANISDDELQAINKVIFSKMGAAQKRSLMERSALEDELLDWMEENGLEDGDSVVDNLVEFGMDLGDLEDIKAKIGDKGLQPVLQWVNQVIENERLVAEIGEASKRINDLVCSIKSYTHMDQAPEKVATDIHIGIDNTLRMLNHKIKKSNIEVVRAYNERIPHPQIMPSEMNQVWTNIIDNAIDAMENSDKKVLEIDTGLEEDYVVVKISDSGVGIPDEVKDKIFDPFYTTKPIGKGTGLGLEVVQQIVSQQHNGSVMVSSEPGKTTFSIYIPVKSNLM